MTTAETKAQVRKEILAEAEENAIESLISEAGAMADLLTRKMKWEKFGGAIESRTEKLAELVAEVHRLRDLA
tara:strand:+ start:817 stop:1032 length:216 start_codon:yes stop_codon:yes gene_type:complete